MLWYHARVNKNYFIIEMRLFPSFKLTEDEKFIENSLVEVKKSSISGGGKGGFCKR